MNDAKKPNARVAMETEVKAAGRVAFGIFDQMFLGGALSSSAPKPPPPSDPYVKQFDLGAIVHYGHAGMQSAPCGATSGMADPDEAKVTCGACRQSIARHDADLAAVQALPPATTIDAPVCPTCAGKGKLGAVGHEIVCPTCRGTGEDRSPKVCPTCQGTKKLGAPGHEIECPQCEVHFGKKVSR